MENKGKAIGLTLLVGFYTKANDLKIEMLKIATQDAYERAKALVSASQGTVGKLIYARQGVFQITSEFSTKVSDYGVNDTTSIDKMIKSIVTVEYAID